MNHDDALGAIQAFTASGNEARDVHTLTDLLEKLGDVRKDREVRRHLIGIFERYPDASFGSPGPIVHSLEESPIDEHLDILAESLVRQPTVMSVWMAERCFRSTLSAEQKDVLVQALRTAQQHAPEGEVREGIEEALEEYA